MYRLRIGLTALTVLAVSLSSEHPSTLETAPSASGAIVLAAGGAATLELTSRDHPIHVVADIRAVPSVGTARALSVCATGDEVACAGCLPVPASFITTPACVSHRWRLERRSYQALPPPAALPRNS